MRAKRVGYAGTFLGKQSESVASAAGKRFLGLTVCKTSRCKAVNRKLNNKLLRSPEMLGTISNKNLLNLLIRKSNINRNIQTDGRTLRNNQCTVFKLCPRK